MAPIELSRRAARRGGGRVVALMVSACLMLGLMCVTGTGLAAAARESAPQASSARPLAGKIIGIDPGHNGLNYTDPGYLNRKVWNGREWEDAP